MSEKEKKNEFVPMPAAQETPAATPLATAPTTTVNPPTSGMAIAGLVCAFIFPLLGLIFSIIGMSQTKNNKQGGRVLAIIGLVVSILGMLVGLFWFVVFIIAAANTDTTDLSTSVSSNSSLSSLTEEKKPDTTARLNEAARDGKFEFTVKGVECGETTVGDQYYSVTAQGEFCMVNIKVTNVGDEPQGLYSSSQYLFNSEGQKYSSDSSATSTVQTGNDLWWSDINPGNTVEGTIVYDVPKGMTPASVELHDSFFSNGILVELK